MQTLEKLKVWAHHLKRDMMLLYVAARDPRVPWYAKAMAGLVVAYAFSPLDLTPDFVPVFGYVAALVIVPLGIVLTLQVVPKDLIPELQAQAEAIASKPVSPVGAATVVTVSLLVVTLSGVWVATLL